MPGIEFLCDCLVVSSVLDVLFDWGSGVVDIVEIVAEEACGVVWFFVFVGCVEWFFIFIGGVIC